MICYIKNKRKGIKSMESEKVYNGKFLDILIDIHYKDDKILKWERC